jgi:hypothetical protein
MRVSGQRFDTDSEHDLQDKRLVSATFARITPAVAGQGAT